jgi:hypothetical protein
MLTLGNNNPSWILSTINLSGNWQFGEGFELDRVFFRDMFIYLFFLRTWNQTSFIAFALENSPVQLLT